MKSLNLFKTLNKILINCEVEINWMYIFSCVQVWASKWNERAYISCRKTNTNLDKLCIGILIQEHIRADYAFVTYTNHPVSHDSSEIYTEVHVPTYLSEKKKYPSRYLTRPTQ